MVYVGKCLVAGSLAGLLNGMFGAGGGLILVPIYISWMHMEEKQAFATSVAVILPLSIISYILFCLQRGNVWAVSLPYLLGGVVGGLLSVRLFQNVSALWLHRIFGAIILIGAIKAVLLL